MIWHRNITLSLVISFGQAGRRVHEDHEWGDSHPQLGSLTLPSEYPTARTGAWGDLAITTASDRGDEDDVLAMEGCRVFSCKNSYESDEVSMAAA